MRYTVLAHTPKGPVDIYYAHTHHSITQFMRECRGLPVLVGLRLEVTDKYTTPKKKSYSPSDPDGDLAKEAQPGTLIAVT